MTASKEDLEKCKAGVEHRLQTFDHRLVVIEQDTQRIDHNTKRIVEILEAWDNAKGFVTTLGVIFKVVKWVTLTGAFFGALWYFFSTGHLPKQ